MRPIALKTALVVTLCGSTFLSSTLAEDWPQWRGPARDGISTETGLLKSWPAEGPRLVWQVKDLGSGYSTPSVADGRVYVMSNDGLENESVIALAARDGSRVWSTRVGKVGNPDQRPNFPAARSTPTVVASSVYALGSDGDLACLESGTGEVLWRKSLRADFDGRPGTWAYSESPLVDGARVICTPGGENATVVALDKENGDVIWKSAVPGGDTAGYASVVITDAGGVKQYVAYTAGGLIGVDAESGRFLWRYERTKGGMGMSILTPVAADGLVYSGAGRVGGGTVRLNVEGGTVKAEEVYFDGKLPTAIGGTVLVEGYLYGSGGQTLVCADFKTGEIKWAERVAAPGAVCYADGRLYFHGEDGTILLVEANSEKYAERGRFAPPDAPEPADRMEKSWAYPIVANGRLYVRNKDSLWCYDIRDRSE